MAGVKGRSGGPRANAGGARPNSGPKPKPVAKSRAKSLQTTDPDEFLAALMANPSIDIRLRLEAAMTLKKDGKGGGSAKGKREAQADAARAVVDRGRSLAPATAPRAKLVAVK